MKGATEAGGWGSEQLDVDGAAGVEAGGARGTGSSLGSPYPLNPLQSKAKAKASWHEPLFRERLLWPGRASPSASQLLSFSPGKEQAAGVIPLWGLRFIPVRSS